MYSYTYVKLTQCVKYSVTSQSTASEISPALCVWCEMREDRRQLGTGSMQMCVYADAQTEKSLEMRFKKTIVKKFSKELHLYSGFTLPHICLSHHFHYSLCSLSPGCILPPTPQPMFFFFPFHLCFSVTFFKPCIFAHLTLKSCPVRQVWVRVF